MRQGLFGVHFLKGKKMKAWIVLLICMAMQTARADALTDRFNTVWESLWFQGGTPLRVERWGEVIRVRVRGLNVPAHRERVIKGLRTVADVAGVKVVDVSDSVDAEERANLDIELVGPRDLADNLACNVRRGKVQNAIILKMEMKMRAHLVYHCVLHEAMHAMGISGHPSGDTMLSYFYQRVDAITDMDRLMLRAWYSPEMKPGMTPLEAVVVLTNAVVKTYGGDSDAARAAQRTYLAQMFQSMEAFAGDKGELPIIIKRSGTASPASMRWGQTVMRHYLGWAYLDGTVVATDPAQAARWFERAARDGLLNAQNKLGELHEKGSGVEPSATEAYFWYGLAAAQQSESGKSALQRLTALLTPEQIDQAKARIAAFKPAAPG